MKKILAAVALLLIANNATAQQYYTIPPRITTIYQNPMQRSVELPQFGRNQHMYWRNAPVRAEEEGDFGGVGLYVYGAFETGSTDGGMNSEYNHDSFPFGSTANHKMGDALGVAVGVGRSINRNVDFEIGYKSFRGMKYGDWTQVINDEFCTRGFFDPENGECLTWDVEEQEFGDPPPGCYDPETGEFFCGPFVVAESLFEVDGGGITSDFISAGLVYRINNLNILGGIRPYFGAHFGMSLNRIDDLIVRDPDDELWFYSDFNPNPRTMEFWSFDEDEMPVAEFDCILGEDAECEGSHFFNGRHRFYGSTRSNFAYALEAGLSVPLENNLNIEFYYAMNNMGKVETSGNVLTHYDVDEYDFGYRSYFEVLASLPICNGMSPSECQAEFGTGFTIWDGDTEIENIGIDSPAFPDFTIRDIDGNPTNVGGVIRNLCESENGDYLAGTGVCAFFFDETEFRNLERKRKEGGTLRINSFGIKLRYLF
ncbi:MAG: hypothetical protein FWD15_04750 [Alphaproteobacteria bacterium]|nr:hypothetical protein [Alphaproteobacteria bacterium]